MLCLSGPVPEIAQTKNLTVGKSTSVLGQIYLTYCSSQKSCIASGFNQTVRQRNTEMRTLYIPNRHS